MLTEKKIVYTKMILLNVKKEHELNTMNRTRDAQDNQTTNTK